MGSASAAPVGGLPIVTPVRSRRERERVIAALGGAKRWV